MTRPKRGAKVPARSAIYSADPLARAQARPESPEPYVRVEVPTVQPARAADLTWKTPKDVVITAIAIVPPERQPSKGERWWIKFSNSLRLTEVEVTDITPGTVCLHEVKPPGVYGQPQLLGWRYARSDVIFVERTDAVSP